MYNEWRSPYMPRVTSRTRNGLAMALESPDLFDVGETPRVDTAIVDAPSLLSDDSLRPLLDDAGVRYLVDTSAWRFGFETTFQSDKWTTLPYSPARPFNRSAQWIQEFVTVDFQTQAALGASAYLLPAWFTPSTTEEAAETASLVMTSAYAVMGRRGLPIMPLVAFVPVRLGNLDPAAAHILEVRTKVQGVYVQADPIHPLRDPVDRVGRLVDLLLDTESAGLPVIAGHLGAIGPTLYALGVSSTDCGIAEAESFSASDRVRQSAPRTGRSGAASSFAGGVRLYVPELGLTLSHKQRVTIEAVRAANAQVRCSRRCHRFVDGADTMARAAHHSIVCRLNDIREMEATPPSMRIDAAARRLQRMGTALGTVNTALRQSGFDPIKSDHVETQRALLARAMRRRGVA